MSTYRLISRTRPFDLVMCPSPIDLPVGWQGTGNCRQCHRDDSMSNKCRVVTAAATTFAVELVGDTAWRSLLLAWSRPSLDVALISRADNER